jgi:hypothetical protein
MQEVLVHAGFSSRGDTLCRQQPDNGGLRLWRWHVQPKWKVEGGLDDTSIKERRGEVDAVDPADDLVGLVAPYLQ